MSVHVIMSREMLPGAQSKHNCPWSGPQLRAGSLYLARLAQSGPAQEISSGKPGLHLIPLAPTPAKLCLRVAIRIKKKQLSPQTQHLAGNERKTIKSFDQATRLGADMRSGTPLKDRSELRVISKSGSAGHSRHIL